MKEAQAANKGFAASGIRPNASHFAKTRNRYLIPSCLIKYIAPNIPIIASKNSKPGIGNKRKKNYPGVTKSQTDFSHHPRISPRTPPCTFFCDCVLQAAIDLAVLRMRSCGRGAKQLEERVLSANPASHLAAHRANF